MNRCPAVMIATVLLIVASGGRAAASSSNSTMERAAANTRVNRSRPASAAARVIALRPGRRAPRGFTGAHGATVWLVILRAEAAHSTAMTDMLEQAARLRLNATVADQGCAIPIDAEYPATVPRGPDAQILTMEFRTERDARRLAAALVEPPVWVGRARVYCRD